MLPAGPPPITIIGCLKVVSSSKGWVAFSFDEDLRRSLLSDKPKPRVSFDQKFVTRGAANPVLHSSTSLGSEIGPLGWPPFGVALQEVCLPRLGHQTCDIARFDRRVTKPKFERGRVKRLVEDNDPRLYTRAESQSPGAIE